MWGFVLSINMRRTLVAALYDKVVRLSMKSMTETNSGKLISLISADLFSIERGLSFLPLMLASPVINIVAYTFIARSVGIKYTLVTFGVWLLLMCMQFMSTNYSKEMKQKESSINDERLKTANDLVVGCRTIKCYGWEEHYRERIRAIRKMQMRYIIRLNITTSLG
mmetsp:Transcript_14678/g.22744  ORF Transcript_14678/g.22744 Transcript_14678/m.22744 type:complete len:166 (-) Transcript_14678:1516-2013(-)